MMFDSVLMVLLKMLWYLLLVIDSDYSIEVLLSSIQKQLQIGDAVNYTKKKEQDELLLQHGDVFALMGETSVVEHVSDTKGASPGPS